MQTYGNKTKETVFLTHESHKLHKEFEAGAPIERSQPVKLNAAGKAVPLAAGDHRNLNLGNSIHESKTNSDNVTVVMKQYLTLLCVAKGVVPAGPVKITGVMLIDSTVMPRWSVSEVEPCLPGDSDFYGIAIEPGADKEYIEVVINP